MAAVFKAGYTAVITGGASGIGLALAKKCHAQGMKVLVADWNEEALAAASTNVGGVVATIRVDVGKPDDWAKLKSKVDAEFGGAFPSLSVSVSFSSPLPPTYRHTHTHTHTHTHINT